MALAQDRGRGRQGRTWQAADGNFYGSTIVSVRPTDPPAPSLSLACGLALFEAINAAAPQAPLRIKWPNDLLLGSAKLAGILLERSGERIVAGFGVNLAQAPEVEGRATAALAPLVTIDPRAFAPLLAASFARLLELWRSSPMGAFQQAWLAQAHPTGTLLSVHDASGTVIQGQFDGLNLDGSMRLRLAGGGTTSIWAGDVAVG